MEVLFSKHGVEYTDPKEAAIASLKSAAGRGSKNSAWLDARYAVDIAKLISISLSEDMEKALGTNNFPNTESAIALLV